EPREGLTKVVVQGSYGRIELLVEKPVTSQSDSKTEGLKDTEEEANEEQTFSETEVPCSSNDTSNEPAVDQSQRPPSTLELQQLQHLQ
ncbi:hypothetical protein PFISCL1PPCAC_4414, partial [Pristionchus fissidentatus]